MGHNRVPISGLMALVALAALGFAALHSGSIWWASGLFTLDVLACCTAAVFALVGRGRLRAFAAGATVFGGVYVALAFNERHGAPAPPLIFKAPIDRWKPRWSQDGLIGEYNGNPGEWVGEVDLAAFTPPGARPLALRRVVDLKNHRRTAHALLALGAALLGGGVGLLADRLSWPRPPAGDPARPG